MFEIEVGGCQVVVNEVYIIQYQIMERRLRGMYVYIRVYIYAYKR